MRRDDDRGQTLPLVLVIMAAAMGTALVLGELGSRALAAARAQTAADAGALAAAAEGPGAGAELARANGATAVAVEGHVGEATVTVRVGEAGAVARAQSSSPPGRDGVEGLTAEMVAAVTRAGMLLGTSVPITSGWRSPAQQAALWANRHQNPYPVAPPGTSRHERGLAVDVPLEFVPRLRAVAAASGLCQPLPVSDPVHFELCGRTTDARVAT